jgi:hypothetical protein
MHETLKEQTMTENIPDLTIDRLDDEHGELILLEQNSGGNLDRVAIHPMHLRYLSEKFGLVPSGDAEATRTIAGLKRRLSVLYGRIDHLANWLEVNSDARHADLSYEQTYARATADIAGEFCADLEGDDRAPTGGDPAEVTSDQRPAGAPKPEGLF